MVKNDNNAIAVVKAVNALMKAINVIEGYGNKVKISPWRRKRPNLEVLKYIKGEKYPDSEKLGNVYMLSERDNTYKIGNML